MPDDKSMTRRNWMQATAGLGAASLIGSTAMAQDGGEKPVRIGIVGGRFGASFQWHLDPECEVVAVCDIQDVGLDNLTGVYGCENRYKEFLEFLDHPGMNAVGLFTPAPLHAWMATEAMKRGKHVISAVPMGMTEAECAQIVDCVKETGMKYMMAETSYYHPEIIYCRELREAGEFGTIYYTEAEYHHEGLIALMFEKNGLPTWRHGFPPMLYPTHCTGMVVPVSGERLTEVSAIGWGDGHEVMQTNEYENPYWSTTGFFRTNKGHGSRITVSWHIAAGSVERATFYGDHHSYIAARPEGSPNTHVKITPDGETVIDKNGYPAGVVSQKPHTPPDYFDRLPEPMRVPTGHGNSHTFLTHEFVRSIIEDRKPAVDEFEAMAYTLPGIIAHQSALRDGEQLKIPQYDPA